MMGDALHNQHNQAKTPRSYAGREILRFLDNLFLCDNVVEDMLSQQRQTLNEVFE